MKDYCRLEIWQNGSRFGVLANAMNVRVREVVNSDYYVTFSYPRTDDDARYDALVEDNEVVFPSDIERGQRFRIRNVQEIRDGRRIYKMVEAHHVAYSLGDYYHDGYIDFAAAKTLPEMLAILGEGTPYSFAVEGAFDSQDIWDWGEDTKVNLLQQLREQFSAELAFDNLEITLTTRKGANNGARVRYAHNLKGIKRTSNNMEQVTRLYGYGKDGLTIEGYAGHSVKYIDSPYFNPSLPKMGKVEFADIDDQGNLLQEMQRYLAKYELPNVSYDVDFVQLEKVDADFLVERIREAGDTVTVTDDILGYAFDARAMEFERYPFEKKSGTVVLSNFRQLTTVDYIFSASVGRQKAIAYTSKNAVLKGVKYDDSLTLVDGFGAKVTDAANNDRVRLGQYAPGKYGLWIDSGAIEITGGLPNSQVAGAANWNAKTTLLTSSGIYTGFIQAEQIFVNNLSAISANLGTITAGSIYGAYINGTTIDGGTITGALIRTASSGTRIELSNVNHLLKALYNENYYIAINPLYGGGPAIQYYNNGNNVGNILMSAGGLWLEANNLYLNAGSTTVQGGWSQFKTPNQTMQEALDAKASTTALASKADISYVQGNFAANMSYDSTTKNLKLFSATGVTLATVNISGS